MMFLLIRSEKRSEKNARLLIENSVEPAIHTLHKHKNYRVPFAEQIVLKTRFYYMRCVTFNEHL